MNTGQHHHPLAGDLDHILSHTKAIWQELSGKTIYITGGTGFFGTWILESLVWANDVLDARTKAIVLTRDAEAFSKKYPHLAQHASLSLIAGDVRSFEFPIDTIDYIIHGAATVTASADIVAAAESADIIIKGTQRMLALAHEKRVKRFLFVSSGAVYGPQPPNVSHISEAYQFSAQAPPVDSHYAQAKRTAEALCVLHRQQFDVQAIIARGFAFIGPHLPIDAHYAIGNFIRDGLNGKEITIEGDGTPYRSYLYAADLAIWLWTLLLRGNPSEAYNVGSDQPIAIADAARKVANFFHPPPAIKILRSPKPGQMPERYVPSIEKAKKELGLRVFIDLDTAIQRTVDWHMKRRTASL